MKEVMWNYMIYMVKYRRDVCLLFMNTFFVFREGIVGVWRLVDVDENKI